MQYEIRKHKGGMRGSKLLTRGFIPWFGLTLSHPYIQVVEALNQEYRFLATKHLPGLFLCRHQGLQVTTVTLGLGSTMELLHEGWESLHPPHKDVDTAPHQAGGSLTCRRATNAPRGRRTEIQYWFTLEPQHMEQHLALSLT